MTKYFGTDGVRGIANKELGNLQRGREQALGHAPRHRRSIGIVKAFRVFIGCVAVLEAELAQNGGRLGFRSVGDDARQLVQQCRAPQSSYLLDERATVLDRKSTRLNSSHRL